MTKRISLADDAYDALAAVKLPGESFSQLARRAAKTLAYNPFFDRSLRLLWTDEEADEMKRKVRAWRDEMAKPKYRWP